MRLPSRAVTLLAVAALPLAALTACSSGSASDGGTSAKVAKAKDPNAGLLTGAQLKKALAPASYFPKGFAVDDSASRDTGDTYTPPSAKPVAKPECDLLAGTSWIELTGIGGVSFAQNSYVSKNTSEELDQEIDVYRGTTAADVLKALPKVVAACPSYMDTDSHSKVKVAGAATAGLGDEAYTITLTSDAWETGTTLIAARKGTAVVTALSTAGSDNGAANAKKLTDKVLSSLKGTDAAKG
ncbi:hypothetical protein [Streptomyces sp. NPDC048242]|uniref:hypothetical protein n=1 Tax=Streptomyces sp. NPDC048242 TaxID=3155026 RepID=UPI0033E08334